ncbi:MAG: hypothetical protein ACRDRF_17440 [Pseudonocardiaceae bacterium]
MTSTPPTFLVRSHVGLVRELDTTDIPLWVVAELPTQAVLATPW